MITHFKNQLDLAVALKEVIDIYWSMKLDEDYLVNYLRQVAGNNETLLFKEGCYTKVVTQKLGKKRLGLLDKVLKNYNND